jgi:uncharacterized protein YbjT (DUF2867 family)
VIQRKLRAAVFGPTGLAGAGVVHAWQAEERVTEVRAITRRPLPYSLPRLTEVACTDFLELTPVAESLSGVDAVCFCLGISASQVKSEQEYRRITHDFALAAGEATLAASPSAVFHFVSGSGVSEKSRMMWARVKAETERDLSRLGLAGCVHWRPAMILAEVPVAGLRRIQRMALTVVRPLRFLERFTVGNKCLGEAMLQTTLDGRRAGTIEHAEIRSLAESYRQSHAEP